MSDKHIYRIEKNRNYSTMSNVHLRDEKLSWKAKGIHSYVLSLPDDWKIRISHLITVGTDGERSTRTGIKELYDQMYWQKYPVYINGIIDHWETKIFEVPCDKKDIIKNIKINNGQEIITYKFNSTDEPAKKLSTSDTPANGESNELLVQNAQVVGNTSVELLVQNVDIGNVDIDKGRLLSTKSLQSTNSIKDEVSKSVDKDKKENTTERHTDLLSTEIKENALIDSYMDKADRKILNLAIDRLLKSDFVGIEHIGNDKIIEHISQLTVGMCDLALDKYKNAIKNNPHIKNKLKYFSTILYNSIDEYYAEIY